MPRPVARSPYSRIALIAALVALLAVLTVAGVRAPKASAALEPGSTAVVQADGDCLRMRAQPSLQGTLVTCIPDGSRVSVLEGAVSVDGYRWQRISYAGREGWSVDQYLQQVATAPSSPPPASPPPPAATPLPTPALTGSMPAAGGFGLAVWGGGPIDRIPPLTAQQGCTLRALWVTAGGDFVGYVFGAPAIVNEAWNGLYPGGSLGANTAVILVCAAAGTSPPPSAPPPSGPAPAPGLPPGTPNLPPGPAGNT